MAKVWWAKSGNPQAMYNLAYLTQTGQGTAKNEKKAIQLYQDAANKGYPVAHYVLAKNYVTGTLGLPQDINKAKQHFEAPIQKGLNSIQDLAKKGYIPALMAVGNMFANGNIIPQNLPEAKKIFTALAKENVPQAKESLAMVDKMIADQAKAPAATAAVKK